MNTDRLAEYEEVVQAARRAADPTEMTGDGPLEPILADPHGCGERELKARMRLLADALARLDSENTE